jgi:hypothetical protein
VSRGFGPGSQQTAAYNGTTGSDTYTAFVPAQAPYNRSSHGEDDLSNFHPRRLGSE